jgi:23S rRNA (cytosine1962-C5)-methyltransferase
MGTHSNQRGALEERIESAVRLREALFGPFGKEGETNAYRLLHAEGDGIPGIAADACAGFLVVQVLEPGAAERAGAVVEKLAAALEPRGIVRKLRFAQEERGRVPDEVVHGDRPDAALVVREAGIPFEVELLGGFHTGLFTDMREEHIRLRALARGRRVLNTFAYTGAFSVAAALGGAAEVTSVDVVPKVLERARRNFELSRLDPEKHRCARMEVLDYLRMAARRGWSFGAIVLDPPTFATFKGGNWSARKSYRELLDLALAVLEPEGLLWAALNTEGTPGEHLEEHIDAALGAAGRRAQTLAVGGLPADYPTPAGSPAARYLKVHVLRVE